MKSLQAQELAESLSPEQRTAFRVICGKDKSCRDLRIEALVILTELGLVRRDRDIEQQRELVLLTNKGRKVEPFV